uniref:Uncharacterized protein n=2 Tax=unclassified Caudoviricetes TaxID=2788787 RepID=A0A8S5NJ53_9CAUD|nr:MAG TPA: hypothetical protein [Siphoviridae sp. ctUF252]DAE01537.1 MAG TPA: hypothetical protein [Siphoviridae sp. ctZHt25]
MVCIYYTLLCVVCQCFFKLFLKNLQPLRL